MSEVQPKVQPIKPAIKYRVELEKRLEINKSYKERRNRAIAIRILSYGLFGQKRFQNLYLSCSLNCFYWALQIANFLHQRVAGLAMIIKFEQVHVIEYYEKELENSKTYAEKKYTKIVIKLTKTPTEEDKKDPGFNPGNSSENIKDELTEIIGANREPRGDRPAGPRRGGRFRRDRGDRGDRPERTDRPERASRPDRAERPERADRNDRIERPRREEDRRDREDRRNREDRTERRERRQEPRRQDTSYRRDDDRRQRRDRDEQREDRRPKRYGDDRDERRIYKNEGQQEKKNTEQQYPRGQPRSRGGPAPRYREAEKREQKPRYEAKQGRAPQREDRGDRRPKNRRYSEDED